MWKIKTRAGSISVSYTHLDVYKRQEYLYGSMVYNFTPYSGMSIQGTKAGAAYDGEQFIISAGGVTGGSVEMCIRDRF